MTEKGKIDFRALYNSETLDTYFSVLSTQEELGMAQFLGERHLRDMRLSSTIGCELTDQEFERVLAYNEIKDLKSSDITRENVEHYQAAVKAILQPTISPVHLEPEDLKLNYNKIPPMPEIKHNYNFIK